MSDKKIRKKGSNQFDRQQLQGFEIQINTQRFGQTSYQPLQPQQQRVSVLQAKNVVKTSNKSSSVEKASAHKAISSLAKYEKKIVESYEKQARKLEATYKNIFLALESHKTQQLNSIRSLLEKQLDTLKIAKTDLTNILSGESQMSPKNANFPTKSSIFIDEEHKGSFGSSDIRALEDSGKTMSRELKSQISQNQIELVKQLNHKVWQRLQFVTIEQSHPVICSPKNHIIKCPTTPDSASDWNNVFLPKSPGVERDGGISYFLSQLDKCMHLMTSTEWNDRRKKKKADKIAQRQLQTISPTQVATDKNRHQKREEMHNQFGQASSPQAFQRPQILSSHEAQSHALIKTNSKEKVAIISSKQKILQKNICLARPASEMNAVIVHQPSTESVKVKERGVTSLKECFGDEISNITQSQAEENFSLILDRNEKGIQQSVESLIPSPKSTKQSNQKNKFIEAQTGAQVLPQDMQKTSSTNSGSKKHNLQILGKNNHQKPVNRRYQDSNSLDRTLDNTKCSENLITQQIDDCFEPFSYQQRYSMGPSKVLVNIASGAIMPQKPSFNSARQQKSKVNTLSQGNSQKSVQQFTPQNSGSQIPKSLINKGFSSCDNTSTQATKKDNSNGSKDSKKQTMKSQSTSKLPIHQKAFSLSQGNSGSKTNIKNQTANLMNGQSKGIVGQVPVISRNQKHGLLRPNSKAKADSLNNQSKKNFSKKTWLTQEDRRFFQILSEPQLGEEPATTTRNNLEHARAQMTELLLQPETSEEPSMANPLNSQKYGQNQ